MVELSFDAWCSGSSIVFMLLGLRTSRVFFKSGDGGILNSATSITNKIMNDSLLSRSLNQKSSVQPAIKQSNTRKSSVV